MPATASPSSSLAPADEAPGLVRASRALVDSHLGVRAQGAGSIDATAPDARGEDPSRCSAVLDPLLERGEYRRFEHALRAGACTYGCTLSP